MNISTIISAVLTISTIFSMPVYASTYQAAINASGNFGTPAQFANFICQASGEGCIVFGGRTALGHRLLRDMSTNDGSTIRLDSGGDVSLKRSFNGGDKSQSLSVQQTSSAAIAPKYFISDLGTLGGTQSFAYGINDSGQVVGYSWLTGDVGGHTFLYSNGKMTDLFPFNSQSILTVGPGNINNNSQIASGVVNNGIYYPAIFDIKTGKITILGSLGGGVTSYGFNGVATSINNLGQAVGYSYIDNINRHAFLYGNGVMKDIGSFGGYSGANAINDKGIIVGFASDQYNGRAHAFLYTNGVMTDIDPFGDSDFSSSESYAYDVNNRGQVVGEFLTADQSAFHAFLYSDGVFTDLGSAGSPETGAFAINHQGQVVGITLIPYDDVCFDYDLDEYVPCIKYKQHAFIYENGNITDLNTLIPPSSGWELTWAFDINNHGQIVGYGLVNDKFRAFLLTPISEPYVVTSAFNVKQLIIDQNRGSLFLLSNFALGKDSNGINPVKEDITLKIANSTLTIPAGSFHKNSHSPLFTFAGQIDNVWIEALITPLGGNRFGFQALAYGAPLGDTKNPVTVELTIGDDGGTTTANARTH